MARATVTLDPERHIYRTTDGTIVPSVTYILGCVGVRPPIRMNALAALERGRAVHLAIHLWTKGELAMESVDPSIRGYLAAFLAWSAAHPMRVPKSEVVLYNETMGYAGTADYIGGDRFGKKVIPTIVDFKTGTVEDWHAYQLQGYAVALLATGKVAPNLMAVYLGQNGDYNAVAVERQVDSWCSIMDTFNAARQRHMKYLESKSTEGEALWRL